MSNTIQNILVNPPTSTPMYNSSGQMSTQWQNWYFSLYNIVSGTTTDATYVVNVGSSVLPNAQVLASLDSGFVKVSAVTGLLSSTSSVKIQTTDLANTGVSAGVYTFNQIPFFSVGLDGRLEFATSLDTFGVAGGDLSGTYPNPIINKVDVIAATYFGAL